MERRRGWPASLTKRSVIDDGGFLRAGRRFCGEVESMDVTEWAFQGESTVVS